MKYRVDSLETMINFGGERERFAMGSELNRRQSSARNDKCTGWYNRMERDFTCRIIFSMRVEKILTFEFVNLSGTLEFR